MVAFDKAGVDAVVQQEWHIPCSFADVNTHHLLGSRACAQGQQGEPATASYVTHQRQTGGTSTLQFCPLVLGDQGVLCVAVACSGRSYFEALI